jgi:hypothetical protein
MTAPRFAYENPTDLAWGAHMVRTWARRRAARLAAEQDQDPPPEAPRLPEKQREGADHGHC